MEVVQFYHTWLEQKEMCVERVAPYLQGFKFFLRRLQTYHKQYTNELLLWRPIVIPKMISRNDPKVIKLNMRLTTNEGPSVHLSDFPSNLKT